MHGNNTMTKETFARAQSHPRKIELARILLGTEADKKQAALDSGFNEMIIKEMARDISKNVEGMQDFAIELQHGAKPAEPETTVEGQEGNTPAAPEGTQTQVENEGEQSSETSNENQTPTTSNDPVDQNPTVETEVVDQTQNPPVQTEGVAQSTPNSTNPGTTPQA